MHLASRHPHPIDPDLPFPLQGPKNPYQIFELQHRKECQLPINQFPSVVKRREVHEDAVVDSIVLPKRALLEPVLRKERASWEGLDVAEHLRADSESE